MSVLENQRKKIEESKAKLKSQEKLLNLKKRQEENKDLYRVGKLAKKASLLEMDSEALLGALTEIFERSSDENQIAKWKEIADSVSGKSTEENDSIIVSFEGEPSKEAKVEIKKLGLKWNRFRKEWYGYSRLENVKEALSNFGAKVESV